MDFTADEVQTQKIKAPFIEDARSDFAPFYSNKKSVKQATAEVESNIAKLGATPLRIESGKFSVEGKTRLGYLIKFLLMGHEGHIRVACLPIRIYTEKKEKQVRVQALLNAAQWLQTLITQQVFNPGANPLVPYLLTGGGKTILEYMMENQQRLMLDAPVVEIELNGFTVEKELSSSKDFDTEAIIKGHVRDGVCMGDYTTSYPL